MNNLTCGIIIFKFIPSVIYICKVAKATDQATDGCSLLSNGLGVLSVTDLFHMQASHKTKHLNSYGLKPVSLRKTTEMTFNK